MKSIKFSPLVLDMAALAALLTIVLVKVFLLEDLSWDDELGYMFERTRMPIGTVTYTYLYALADLITDDVVRVYYIGRFLGAASMVIGVWIAGRLIGTPAAARTGAALLVLTGAPFVWPGVSSFASGLIVCAIALVVWRQDWLGTGLSSVLLWLAASSRPEFWPAALCSTAVAAISLYREWRRGVAASRGPVAAVTALVAGVPIALAAVYAVDFGSNRTLVAFGQHYALRHVRADESNWVDWHKVVVRDFGEVGSVLDVVRSDPARVVDHVVANIVGAPGEFWKLLVYGAQTPDLALPSYAAVAVLIAVTAAGWWVLRGSKQYAKTSAPGEVRFASVVFLPAYLALILSAATVVFIYPRLHYLQLWVALLIVVAVRLLSRMQPRIQAVVSIVCFAALLLPFLFTLQGEIARPRPREIAAVVSDLQKLEGHQIAASTFPQLTLYVPSVKVVSPREGELFADFVEREHVTVLVDWALNDWYDTPGFTEFDPVSAGFSRLDSDSMVFVRFQPSP